MLTSYAKRWGMSGYHAILRTHIMNEDQLANALAKELKAKRGELEQKAKSANDKGDSDIAEAFERAEALVEGLDFAQA